jgi:hypothetical protein
MLPLVVDPNVPDGTIGREALSPVLAEEVSLARRFELIQVTPEKLRALSERAQWTAEEKLPPEFFDLLRRETGCDAVLFSRLTHYRPYSPVALGWSLKLVRCAQPRILWAADEVFDASHAPVSNSARRYEQANSPVPSAIADSRSILQSPRRFGHYSLSALMNTMPLR